MTTLRSPLTFDLTSATAHQPPNGTPQGANISAEKQIKIKQHLEYIRMLFRRLRIYHERVSECCAGFEFTPVEVGRAGVIRAYVAGAGFGLDS